MNRIRWIPNSTPFPNVLLDQVMPNLRDTEWRLVVVITRATLGWFDRSTGGRRERELLSGSQLRRRSGRESAAVSLAIENLVRSKLIAVTDIDGRIVETPAKRRRLRKSLYYGLHPDILIRLTSK